GDAAEEYIAFLTGQFPLDLSGLRIAVDCGNGAASRIAPEVLRRLGAEVTVYHAEPNGVNINVGCGSTHPAVICQAVKETGADLGFTYDGDADRMLAVDERGQLVDGDHILAILASDMMERGVLRNRKIAATPYSNLGLRLALEAIGASVVETAAGDRHVLEAMRKLDLVLGGEQSGHIILLERNTTGDGLLAGLALLDVLKRRRVPLSTLAGVMKRYPQILEAVRVADKEAFRGNQAIQEEVRAAEAAIGGRGRIFVRPSGAEPVIRVMAEGEDEAAVRAAVQRVVDVIRRELGDA